MNHDIFNVNDNIWEQAAALFERNEEMLNEDVQTIKNWFKRQPHLPEIMDDIKIKNFLLLNKCSVEKTKQKIDMYYTIRSLIPDFYEHCNPKSPQITNAVKNTYFTFTPKLVDNFYRVFFINPKEPNKYAPRELSMELINFLELRLYNDCMVGDIWVLDLKNFALNDIVKVTPTLVAEIIAIYKKVYSLRIKAVFLINSPSYVGKLLAVFKMVLKPKIYNRFQVFEDAEILNTVFSNEDLPKDYGGKGPSLQKMQDDVLMKLTEYQERFDRLDKLRVNESLRPEKLNDDEILGFYGNFKKLSID